MNTTNTSGELARIFLKDGNQKMGLLLNDVDSENAFDEGVKYIPHNNVGEWLQSFSQEFVHVLEAESVDGIDLFMK
ncbi:MAG: hypothetical protein NT084_05820 [Bacteroidetes bacterium]|jgi:hypothetical protein|nr:hypothetical protein [Bacteroidota bacterium]